MDVNRNNFPPRRSYKWIGRPEIDFGLALYMRSFNLRDFNSLSEHDFGKKANISKGDFQRSCYANIKAPSFEEFLENYSDFFTVTDKVVLQPCPGQQSFETVMENHEPEQEPQKVEKNDPGSVYGVTPNNVKQQSITFADLFNKCAQPFEIDGKLYKPHLELLDVNSDQN